MKKKETITVFSCKLIVSVRLLSDVMCLWQIKKAAQKRKEEDADFEEKRMILGITADEDDDEHDKENLARRCDVRSRLDPTHREGDDIGARRPEDIVSRWRDKRDVSPYQYRVSVTIGLGYYKAVRCVDSICGRK